MEQATIFDAIALAEAGMAQTLQVEGDAWLDRALIALREFAAGWGDFKVEDFRAWYSDKPHDPHVWGAFANRAAKRGVIRWTGIYRNSVSPKTHGHPVKVWTINS